MKKNNSKQSVKKVPAKLKRSLIELSLLSLFTIWVFI